MSTTKSSPKRTKPARSEFTEPSLNVNGKLIDSHGGYCPFRADVLIPSGSKPTIKRLAMTLDATGAKLSDGTLVKNSVPKAIAWLIEQFCNSCEES